MRILFDCNALLDIGLRRKDFVVNSKKAFKYCVDKEDIEIFVAWHSLSNIFYIMSKEVSKDETFKFLRSILETADVAKTGRDEAIRAFDFCSGNYGDYEDALQISSALSSNADKIITRDVKGYMSSPLPVFTPTNFLEDLGVIERE